MKKRGRSRSFILGITGGFGSGKSTVAGMFGSLGAKVINADKIAHGCLRPKSKAYRRVCALFKNDMLKEDRSIDREKLADKVFTNKQLLKKLNSIIHPLVKKIIKDKVAKCQEKVIVLDVPLLIESGFRDLVDKLIVVKSARLMQLERTSERQALDRKAALRRIRSQMPLSKKVQLADFVIDNNGMIKETRKQVKEIWQQLKLRRQTWKK